MIDERDEILKGLRAGPLVLRALLRDLPAELVRRRPAEGEWAIAEVVAHLADTEERSLARTRRMLDEDLPIMPSYDPYALSLQRGYLTKDVGAELDRFASLRADTTDLLTSLDQRGWERAGRHEEHGVISVKQLAAHTAGEDADHFAQIARLIPLA